MKPVRVLPVLHEKVWGSYQLAPWFDTPDMKIGEAWFTSDRNPTSEGATLRDLCEKHGAALLGSAVRPAPGGRFPILVKFIFTTEKLSVQVHPDDDYAVANEGSPGKTEMWYILKAEPDARLALGFRERLTRQRLREALAGNAVENLLEWLPARTGDTFFTPARTVHAIGGGLALCEIQQNSDITYRLYDYGRPREIHVEQSLAVLDLEPHPGKSTPLALPGGGQRLATCPYFETDRLVLSSGVDYHPDPERFHLLVLLAGSGCLAGERYQQGQCWLVPASARDFRLDPDSPTELLKTFVPKKGTDAFSAGRPLLETE